MSRKNLLAAVIALLATLPATAHHSTAMFDRNKRIWVEVSKPDKIRIEVRDEGPGLSENDARVAFGHFQRLSARPTGGESSSGIGLSIVKQIVELHGGSVRVEHAQEGGASFIIEL